MHRTVPRLITHRPDDLRLPAWGRDGALAEALDVSFATGRDWHTPGLVLVDAACVDLLEALYGPRAGETLAVAAGRAEVTHLAGRLPAVDVDLPGAVPWLTRWLSSRAGHPAGRNLGAARPVVPTRRLRVVTDDQAG